MRKLFYLTIAMTALSLLASCAPLVVAGAGAGGVAAHDRRSVGALVDDAAIELRGEAFVTADDDLKRSAHVNFTSVNGIVLLTGETVSAEHRDRVLAEVRNIPSVRRVVNEIRIKPPSAIGSRANDTWLTTKIKTKLLNTRGVDSSRVKAISEGASVYLLGLVTQEEGELATEAARRVNGVERVVKLFEYIE